MLRPGKPVEEVPVRRYGAGIGEPDSTRDEITVEEPLEIRVAHAGKAGPTVDRISVTMRTPGDDFELAAGFLHAEGLVEDLRTIAEISYCADGTEQAYNVLTVRLRPSARFDPALLDRNFYTTSSCGVCGKASLEAVEIRGCEPLPAGRLRVGPERLARIPERLRGAQPIFGRTGGIHAAALFASDGELDELREDVGRHNAVDKVLGHAFLEERLPLADRILAVSGRASFEIMQKALVAGVPVVVAVGAPSSLAVDVARRFQMTLAGFARDGGFNLYAGEERVVG